MLSSGKLIRPTRLLFRDRHGQIHCAVVGLGRAVVW